MKEVKILCDFANGAKSPFVFKIGSPELGHHPIQFQNNWFSAVKGGLVPSEIMTSMQELLDISSRNNVSFEELCFYVMVSSIDQVGKSVDGSRIAED